MTIDELKAENKALQEKLDIAVRALKFYAYPNWWMLNPMGGCAMDEQTYRPAQSALKEIEEQSDE